MNVLYEFNRTLLQQIQAVEITANKGTVEDSNFVDNTNYCGREVSFFTSNKR